MGKLITVTELKAALLAAKRKPLSSPKRLGVGQGLHLLLKPGAEGGSWVLRLVVNGKRRDMGLGAYPAVSLAEARQGAAEALQQARSGMDPLAARNAQKAAQRQVTDSPTVITFRDAAIEVIASKRHGWSNPKHAAQWISTLEKFCFPVIGDVPVDQVDTPQVLKVLRPIWTEIPETASRLRQRVEAILDAARALGLRSGENAARWRGHLSEVLPPPRRVKPVKHQPSLPWQQMAGFMRELDFMPGIAPMALRFILLTAARTGEVRAMRWGEVDLQRRIWTVPAQRMKARRLHRKPLEGKAFAILQELRTWGRGHADDLVFPSEGGRALSDMSIAAVIRRMNEQDKKQNADTVPKWRSHDGRPVVPHGFRTSFKGWARANAYPDELSEIALAHADKDKVRAAYAREDLLEERRPMMAAWSEWCCPKPIQLINNSEAEANE
jgi:integrase